MDFFFSDSNSAFQLCSCQAFDDVVRKEKPKEEVFEFKKRLTLDHEKSKQSLAEIYEQEYVKQNQVSLFIWSCSHLYKHDPVLQPLLDFVLTSGKDGGRGEPSTCGNSETHGHALP